MVSVPENPLNDVMGRAPRIMAANGTCCRGAATIGNGVAAEGFNHPSPTYDVP